VTSLPLHGGKAPAWLFAKMKRLSAALIEIILLEFGPEELLRRIADPHWFQAMGCVVGFDWHSSGVTTTLCGALKEGFTLLGDEMPIAICGGKAKRAIETPKDIALYGDKWHMDTSRFVSLSRLCAKIDNTAIQDGYSLYHHTFIFTKNGEWAIVQQDMNGEKRMPGATNGFHGTTLISSLTLIPVSPVTTAATSSITKEVISKAT
jgi:uncharacterized protein